MKDVAMSVVMSVFNGQQFLAQAIESILTQSFGDFEFLVIDDGSTDATPNIISEYASHDQRIRVVRHTNKGRAESLNVGLALASGKYIARMDADDVALPHRLERQIEFMERNSHVGVLAGSYELIDASGRVIDTVRLPTSDSGLRSLMLHYNPICHPTVLLRKECVLGSGGYRKPLLDADDYDLFLRMADRSELASLAVPILQYRIHANQVSVRNMKHQALCVLAARASASQRRSGSMDPLLGVHEITPELLNSLGISSAQIHENIVGVYRYWIVTLGQSDPEGSLKVIEALLKLSPIERSVVADAHFKAATIHFRRDRFVRALSSGGQALLASPPIVNRLFKWAFRKIAPTPLL